jgi:hypothetical protein
MKLCLISYDFYANSLSSFGLDVASPFRIAAIGLSLTLFVGRDITYFG